MQPLHPENTYWSGWIRQKSYVKVVLIGDQWRLQGLYTGM